MTNFGPTGELVYNRTYSRTKPNGEKETWPETVRRVVDGNLGLVQTKYQEPNEREQLIELMEDFKVLPAGRHLWASGVGGRQYLFNCHVAPWPEDITEHFSFTFLRLMEGGGVGSNYSNRFLGQYVDIENALRVHIVCDPEHPDFEKMSEAGILSSEYDADWPGAYEVEDSREGWADALTELLSTFYRESVEHENRVFDVSRVRAEGARLKTFGGRASGPMPLGIMLTEVARVMNRHQFSPLTGMEAMEIDHAIAKCVVSGGNRRSARMSIMQWDDPEISRFLACKYETGQHWTTNISVEVDDEFWDDLDDGQQHANGVLRAVAQGMLENGEPGLWDATYSNEGEPNEVIATNPCGEIALEPSENCNLGHINLAAFVQDDSRIDLGGLLGAHRLMTRFLMRATYGDVNDPRQAATLARNRRIGVGHFGFASAIAKMGIRYSEVAGDESVSSLLKILSREVDKSAERYAHHLRIPVPVKKRTVAPTGTIAKMPGVSEGIHPIFAKWFIRRVRLSTIDPDQLETAMEYSDQGYNVESCQYAPSTVVIDIPTKDSLMEEVTALYGEAESEEIVESVEDLALSDMLGVQTMYQEYWSDNAVSYTANIDPDRYTVENVMITLWVYGRQVKGCTVFPETSMPQAPYERLTKEQYEQFENRQVADGIDENCQSGACPVR